MVNQNYTDLLLETVDNMFNKNIIFIDFLNELETLIKKGADVNSRRYYYDDINELEGNMPLLNFVCSYMNPEIENETISFERSSQVAEILILNGASIGVKDDYGYTAFDYMLRYDKTNKINQSTYRLFTVMITSLTENQMNEYLLHNKNEETFSMLQNVFKVFDKYDKHIQYMF